MKRITDVTRTEIFECIKYGFDEYMEVIIYDVYDRPYADQELKHSKFTFNGKLEELKFLDRVFDLKNLPSTDSRFENAEGDIWQHTINNYD
jgi:hypothetical protein